MKKNFGIILAIALGLSALLLTIAFQAGWVSANPFAQEERAGAPTIVSYQGQIWDGKIPYDGTGYFKFAIYDSSINQTWSNDGNDPPTTAVPLDVVNGLFSVNLGDTKIDMEPLEAKAFDDPGTFLQVWFSPTGTGSWTEMPEQRIAAVPYALQAQVADLAIQAYNAESLDFIPSSSFQLRVTGTCPPGQAVRQINSNGTVICEAVESKPVHSITTLDSLNNIGLYNSITIGTDGLGLISYFDNTNGDLRVAHCKNIACTEVSTNTINDNGLVGFDTSITIGGDGLGIISYYGWIGPSNYDLKVAHCNDVACGSATVSTIASVGNASGHGTSITTGHGGHALISYYDGANQDLRLARCLNQTCSSSTTYLIDSANDVGNNSSITLGGAGYAVIAHFDMTNYDLKVSYFSLDNFSTKGTNTIDSTGLVGLFPSISIGVDGLPIISYIDIDSACLKVAHCNNSICNTGSTNNPLFWGQSTKTAISIGSDGLPVISFYETVNDNLKVIKCTKIDCSDVRLSTFTGSLGDGNRSTSITIGMDGFPLISFYDATNGDLLVAHCSNTGCIPYFRGR